MQELDDINLAKVAGNGDREAFSTLLERHYMTIFKMAYKWTGSRADAQDVAQEVCIKLANVISSFQGDSAFTSWLYRVVVNTAKDFHKASGRKSLNEKAFMEQQSLETAPHTQEDSVQAAELYRAIHGLSEGLRDAVMLVLVEGLSHREAGEILGCAEGTISWRVSEGRKQLQTFLEGGK